MPKRCRVFLTVSEKNLIYEANIANPPTVEVISKTFKDPHIHSRKASASSQSFVIALELVDFIFQADKPLAQYSKISVDRLKGPLVVKESMFGLLTVRIRSGSHMRHNDITERSPKPKNTSC